MISKGPMRRLALRGTEIAHGTPGWGRGAMDGKRMDEERSREFAVPGRDVRPTYRVERLPRGIEWGGGWDESGRERTR